MPVTSQIALVVPDPFERGALSAILRDAAYAVQAFPDAEQMLLHFLQPTCDGDEPGVDLLIVHEQLPGMSADDAMTQFAKLKPTTPTLLLCKERFDSGNDKINLRRTGASGLLHRIAYLLNTACTKPDEQRSISSSFLPDSSALVQPNLTRREVEIYALIVTGLKNQGIADKLGISLPTVKMHRTNLMRKMGATSAAHLVGLHYQANRG